MLISLFHGAAAALFFFKFFFLVSTIDKGRPRDELGRCCRTCQAYYSSFPVKIPAFCRRRDVFYIRFFLFFKDFVFKSFLRSSGRGGNELFV